MSYPEKFRGFQSPSKENWLAFQKNAWEPRPLSDYDVDIKVVGKVVQVGSKVTLAKVGQRVGAGAQIYSCLECPQCMNENETYCTQQIDNYGQEYLDTGKNTQGGFSSHERVHEYWVFGLPDALSSTQAASMLCAGITAYSPLKRFGAGLGKKVGVVGIGGLGHYAVMFAKALGAETWATSRSRAKEADTRKMGADGFIATGEEGWEVQHRMIFDLIINTASSFDGFQLNKHGTPEPRIYGKWLFFIGTTHLGSRNEMLEMLQLAADKGIKGWVEEIPISREGLAEAMDKLEKSAVRYRWCMVGYEGAFGP